MSKIPRRKFIRDGSISAVTLFLMGSGILSGCTTQKQLLQIGLEYVRRHKYDEAQKVIPRLSGVEDRNRIWSEMALDILTYGNDYNKSIEIIYNINSDSHFYTDTLSKISEFEARQGSIDLALNAGALISDSQRRDPIIYSTGELLISLENEPGALKCFSAVTDAEKRYSGLEKIVSRASQRQDYEHAIEAVSYITDVARRDQDIFRIAKDSYALKDYNSTLFILSHITDEEEKASDIAVFAIDMMRNDDLVNALRFISYIKSEEVKIATLRNMTLEQYKAEDWDNTLMTASMITDQAERDSLIGTLVTWFLQKKHYDLAILSSSYILDYSTRQKSIAAIALDAGNGKDYKQGIAVVSNMEDVNYKNITIQQLAYLAYKDGNYKSVLEIVPNFDHDDNMKYDTLRQLCRMSLENSRPDLALVFPPYISDPAIRDASISDIIDYRLKNSELKESINDIATLSKVEDRDRYLVIVADAYISRYEAINARNTSYLITNPGLRNAELAKIMRIWPDLFR